MSAGMDVGVVVALSAFGVIVLVAVLAAVISAVSTVSSVETRDGETENE